MARSLLALGGTGLAAAERAGRELIERSPFREAGHRLLMEALAGDGNVAEALRAYDALRVLLRDELGTAPAAELQALHLRLLAGEGAGRAPAPAGPVELPAPLALTSRLPFAGRASASSRRWPHSCPGRRERRRDRAHRRRGRLREEPPRARVRARRLLRGVRVLHGACDAVVRTPYRPFVEALDQLVRGADSATLRADLGPAGAS